MPKGLCSGASGAAPMRQRGLVAISPDTWQKALYDHAPLPYLVLTHTGRVVDMNVSAAHLLGPALVGCSLTDILAEGRTQLITALSDPNVLAAFRARVLTAEVGIIPACVELSKSLEGMPEQYRLAALFDLRDLEMQQSSFAESERRCRQVFEASRDPLLLLDEQWRVWQANSKAALFWNVPASELKGATLRTLFSSEGAEHLVEQLSHLTNPRSCVQLIVPSHKGSLQVDVVLLSEVEPARALLTVCQDTQQKPCR